MSGAAYTPFFAFELKRFSECEIDPPAPELRTFAVFERRDAVIEEAGRGAPNNDISVSQGILGYGIGALRPPELKGSPKSERDRNDRARIVSLILILVQR